MSKGPLAFWEKEVYNAGTINRNLKEGIL